MSRALNNDMYVSAPCVMVDCGLPPPPPAATPHHARSIYVREHLTRDSSSHYVKGKRRAPAHARRGYSVVGTGYSALRRTRFTVP